MCLSNKLNNHIRTHNDLNHDSIALCLPATRLLRDRWGMLRYFLRFTNRSNRQSCMRDYHNDYNCYPIDHYLRLQYVYHFDNYFRSNLW